MIRLICKNAFEIELIQPQPLQKACIVTIARYPSRAYVPIPLNVREGVMRTANGLRQEEEALC